MKKRIFNILMLSTAQTNRQMLKGKMLLVLC